MSRLRPLLGRAMILLRYVLIVMVVGFAVYFLASQWSGVQSAVKQIAPLSLVLSFLLVLAGLAAGTLSWVTVLNGLGPRVPVIRGAQVLLVGQLGKYVPGSVWSYVMQMELGRQYGILRPRVLVTALYSAGIGVVSSLLLGALALPAVLAGHEQFLWLFLLLPVGIVCLHPRVMTWLASLALRLFRRPPLEHRVSFTTVGLALFWSLVSYVCYGLHLWLLVNSLVDPGVENLILLTGAVSLAFTVGLFAFVFPSGVGVREAVLIAAMAFFITVGQAAGISLVSRAMFTGADLLAAGVAMIAAVILRRRIAREQIIDEYGPEDEELHRSVRSERREPA